MLFRRNRRALDAAPAPPAPETAADVEGDEGELSEVASLSSALAHAHDEEAVARTLIEECTSRFDLDFAAVALVSEDGKRGSGLLAVARNGDTEWWRDVTIDFENEPSGIASAAFEGGPVVVHDVAGSSRVNRRLAEKVGAKSAIFIPLVSRGKVPAVLVIATTREPRVFTEEDLAVLQALAAETALALDRAHSASALAEALERERLVASIGRKVRSEIDLEAVLRVAVEETGKAMGATRCFLTARRAGWTDADSRRVGRRRLRSDRSGRRSTSGLESRRPRTSNGGRQRRPHGA